MFVLLSSLFPLNASFVIFSWLLLLLLLMQRAHMVEDPEGDAWGPLVNFGKRVMKVERERMEAQMKELEARLLEASKQPGGAQRGKKFLGLF